MPPSRPTGRLHPTGSDCARPAGDSTGRTGRPMPGSPSPTPGVRTAIPAADRSPAVVRRWVQQFAVGEQVVRRSVGHPGRHHVSRADRPVDRRPDRGEVHQPAVPGPAAHPPAVAVLVALAGGHQHLDDRTHLRPVAVQRRRVDDLHQPPESLGDHLAGYLIGHRGGGGARSRRVLEGEGTGEVRLRHHVQGLLEVRLGLAGEADDDVRGDRRVRHRRAHLGQDRQVPLTAVGAAHRPEHPIGAGLQRHVQLVADVGRGRHRVDHVVGEVLRVRPGEPHPLQPVDPAAGAEQLAERRTVAELDAVGVDVLPEQGDLEDALVDQHLHLGEDVAGPAVGLLAAQRRHDAERAGVVAAHRDRHPAGVGRFPLGRQRGREDLERLQDLDLGLWRCAGTAPAASAASRRCACRTRRRPTARGAGSRRGPSGRGSRRPRSACRVVVGLDRGQVPEVAVQLVVGVLPDRAGVEDDHVGRLALLGRRRSRPARAARTGARSRARSSGSRRCGPGRCVAG